MEQFNDIEPEIIFKFLQDLYMNDSISGSQTSHEGINFYLFVKTLKLR